MKRAKIIKGLELARGDIAAGCEPAQIVDCLIRAVKESGKSPRYIALESAIKEQAFTLQCERDLALARGDQKEANEAEIGRLAVEGIWTRLNGGTWS